MDINGKNTKKVPKTGGPKYFPSRAPYWSPDGSKLVYIINSERVCGIDEWDVCVIDIDGQKWQNLTEGLDGQCSGPVWSPDGKQIAFSHFIGGWKCSLMIMDNDGSNLATIADDNIHFYPHERSICWSPGGGKIVYTSKHSIADVDFGLIMINPDGTGKQRILHNNTTVLTLDWAPIRFGY